MKQYVAKSLEKLFTQLNEKYPNRSRVSDGSWGDARHQKAGTSDHLPNKYGAVTARDFTFDQNDADGVGINCFHLADALVKSRDPRIKYIIFNSRIYSNPKNAGWAWRKYSGQNPHNHHLHLSVVSDPKLADSTAEWNLTGLSNEAELPRTYTIKPGDALSVIYKRFGLTKLEFFQKNGLTTENFDENRIRVGDTFRV